jgi:hypothetical protein
MKRAIAVKTMNWIHLRKPFSVAFGGFECLAMGNQRGTAAQCIVVK